jgi:ribulose 1,5-bisphosphate synthetase/thiazole synthase
VSPSLLTASHALTKAEAEADTLSNVDVLVIGAGPTGLGAAKRLHQIVRLLNVWSSAERRLTSLEWPLMVDRGLQ